jgi:hypothetical protein
MLSNLPSRINYRTPSDIRQDLRNWVQPISEMTTEPVRKPLQPISEQSTALKVLATTQRSINRLRDGLQLISDAATAIA